MALSWTLFLIYVVATFVLAWLGQRRTRTLADYAIGSGTMHPVVVGLALAASVTSTATFVINPGIVYAYGVSAVLAYGLAAGAGLGIGLVVLSKGFRRLGVRSGALTVPQWIGQRYGDARLTRLYAAIHLLLVAMVVLVCYAMAGLMVATLGLDAWFPDHAFELALTMTTAFVFSYVAFGGTYAHAYTNTLQGVLMVGVALLLVGSGSHLWSGGLLEALRAIDPVLAAPVNPGSLLFRNTVEVFGVNLVVGFALAVQPHFLVKSLYVETDGDVNRYLAVAIGVGTLFNLVLLCGLYARVDAAEFVARFTADSGLGIDGVMPAYIAHRFPPVVGQIVSIALLAAGMSTLDGILVALSTVVATDILGAPGRADGGDAARAFRASRWSLLGIAVVSFGLAWLQHQHKEFSIALFAQEGVYALFAATFAPIVCGILPRRPPAAVVAAGSLVALAVHFGFRYGGLTWLTEADHTNPGLTATYGLLASLAVVAPSLLRRPRSHATP